MDEIVLHLAEAVRFTTLAISGPDFARLKASKYYVLRVIYATRLIPWAKCEVCT
jgi:hypothetical protein